MAQAQQQRLQQAMRALDEQWGLRHGLFWLLRTAWMTGMFLFVLHTTASWELALRDSLLLLPPILLATYSLLYGVLPLLWQPGRRGYFGVLLALWLMLGLALTFAHRFYIFIPSHRTASAFPDYSVVFATGAHMPLLLTAGVAACLHLYRRWRRKELANELLLRENYQAELQLLKSQIHPHFLFNTLNNLYALTLRQSGQATEVVERLTGLLRFVLEQGNAPQVALPDEVALLRNYMALERLRYGPRLALQLEAPELPATVSIAPLLLLPLVENAFKHGSSEQLGLTQIGVQIALAGQTFTCRIENTKNADEPTAGRPEGIGLRNVHQRLQLLYPHRHQLVIEAHPDRFVVRLTLQLATAAAPDPALAAGLPGATPVSGGCLPRLRHPDEPEYATFAAPHA